MIDDLILPFIPHQGTCLSSGRTLAILKVLTDLQKTMPAGLFGDFKKPKKGLISHDFDLWIRKEVQSCRAFWVQMRDFNRHFWFQRQTSRGEVHRRSSLHQHAGTSIHSVGLDLLRNVQKWDYASRFSLLSVSSSTHIRCSQGWMMQRPYMQMWRCQTEGKLWDVIPKQVLRGRWTLSKTSMGERQEYQLDWAAHQSITGNMCDLFKCSWSLQPAWCSLSCNFIGARNICKIKSSCWTLLMC